MKKLRFSAVLALVGLAACAGENGARELVSVRFEVETGVTRGAAEIAALLVETAPTGSLQLRLEGDGVDVTVASGQAVEVLTGRYRVTGRYESPAENAFIGFAHEEPVYVVDAEVEIRSDREQYLLPARYDCWALVMDTDETEYYKGDGVMIGGFAGSGRYVVTYLTGTATDWVLTVVPVDGALYAETEYQMGSQENGRWYCYRAGHGVTGGTFGVVLPEWEEGE